MNNKSLKLNNATFTQTNKRIEVNFNKKIPDTLYKYYSVSKYSIEGLKNNTIYFSHAHLLNDVMDGNLMLWDTEKFISNLINERQEIYNKNDIINEIKGLSEPLLKNIGVFSLSNTYKNELIWVHYTNEYGYCVELKTEKLLKYIRKNRNENDILFFPVSYNNLKQIDFSEYITTKRISKNESEYRTEADVYLPIIYCFAQKDKFWKYEKEWRLLLRDKNFKSIKFPLAILDDDQKKEENEGKIFGNVKINNNILGKIILAPLFFNNNRFNKFTMNENNTRIYHFKSNKEGKLIKEFLKTLKNDFNDRIYQIDKFIEKKIIVRDIKYKIEILRIDNDSVELKKYEVNN